MRFLALSVLSFASLGIAIGCSSDDSSQPDASPDASDGGFVVATHAPLPQAVNAGGSVMASPKLVAISFQGDPLQPDIDAFASDLVSAPDYWHGAVSEYGVGPISQVAYHAQEAAPGKTISDGDVQTWITNKIQTDATFPQPDANTIYAMFYPSGTAVALGLDTTCQQVQGYHDAYPISGTLNVSYAVIPRCAPPPVAGVTAADQMTAEASHEIIEAATDPEPAHKAAYYSVDDNSHAWELIGGGEIGDLCEAFPDAFYVPQGFSHLMQHVWSNAAAAANHDPCQPNGASPYFNSAALVSDTITIRIGGQPIKTQGVKLAVGASTTIELDLYSDAPTAPWKVSTLDFATIFGETAALDMSLDTNTGQNGDKINLTIKLLRSVIGGAGFWIQSDLTQDDGGVVSSVWLGAVNPN